MIPIISNHDRLRQLASGLTQLWMYEQAGLPCLHRSTLHPVVDPLEVDAFMWVIRGHRQQLVVLPLHGPHCDIAVARDPVLQALKTMLWSVSVLLPHLWAGRD